MSKEFLPCPFCGGEADFEYNPWDEETQSGDDGLGRVECQECHVTTAAYCSREEAREQWNRRANSQ